MRELPRVIAFRLSLAEGKMLDAAAKKTGSTPGTFTRGILSELFGFDDFILNDAIKDHREKLKKIKVLDQMNTIPGGQNGNNN